ncbi:MAG: hypothetical protein MHM6MM_000149 [Cercozoa sp. M6MM]
MASADVGASSETTIRSEEASTTDVGEEAIVDESRSVLRTLKHNLNRPGQRAAAAVGGMWRSLGHRQRVDTGQQEKTRHLRAQSAIEPGKARRFFRRNNTEIPRVESTGSLRDEDERSESSYGGDVLSILSRQMSEQSSEGGSPEPPSPRHTTVHRDQQPLEERGERRKDKRLGRQLRRFAERTRDRLGDMKQRLRPQQSEGDDDFDDEDLDTDGEATLRRRLLRRAQQRLQRLRGDDTAASVSEQSPASSPSKQKRRFAFRNNRRTRLIEVPPETEEATERLTVPQPSFSSHIDGSEDQEEEDFSLQRADELVSEIEDDYERQDSYPNKRTITVTSVEDTTPHAPDIADRNDIECSEPLPRRERALSSSSSPPAAEESPLATVSRISDQGAQARMQLQLQDLSTDLALLLSEVRVVQQRVNVLSTHLQETTRILQREQELKAAEKRNSFLSQLMRYLAIFGIYWLLGIGLLWQWLRPLLQRSRRLLSAGPSGSQSSSSEPSASPDRDGSKVAHLE